MKSKKNKKGNWKQKTANLINFAFEAKVKGIQICVKNNEGESIINKISLINKLKYHTTKN